MPVESERPQRCTSPRRSYTLIELLIVIAVLGIAGALVVPQLVGRDSLTVQAAVRLIITDLHFAQSDALAHQEFRRVVFFDDGSGYAIVRVTLATFSDPFDPATADYIDDPMALGVDQGRYVVEFTTDTRFDGVGITAVNIDDNKRYVTYDSLGGTVTAGGVPGTGGLIELSYGDEKYRVDLAPFTGKLTVQKLP